MTPAAWRDVEVVLSEVMDLPAAERSARIVQLCGARADLKAEVGSLLSAHKKAASFLEGNAEFDLTATPAFSLQGKQLGPYRVTRRRKSCVGKPWTFAFGCWARSTAIRLRPGTNWLDCWPARDAGMKLFEP